MVIISLLLIIVKKQYKYTDIQYIIYITNVKYTKYGDYYNATFFTVLPSTTIYTPVRGCNIGQKQSK